MPAALERRVLDCLEQALDMEDDARAVWLKKTEAEDPALAARVRTLLRVDLSAASALPTGSFTALAHDTAPPARIGQYRIVERIGGGGMGEVFAGARDDGLFEHRVAIKLVRPSLLPETSRALFHTERRALAKLSHRHIAQLYDGGVAESGAPYLVMELVDGAPIDVFARDRKLSPQEIVKMLIGVCDAVQHAHQNLIVHADLKPANILINADGDAKIVDFGVARILQESERAEDALYPHTPDYASPQRLDGDAPTPADDIFALGALLRALITGDEPGAPTPVSLADGVLASKAYVDMGVVWLRKRARSVRGDLEAIAARACAAEAGRRYPSAAALRDDLSAWIDLRPIAARAHERLYVTKKFVRRRRLRVIAAAAALSGGVAALAVTTSLYVQAEHARAEAEARFVDVRGLSRYLLFDVYERLERTPHSLAMRRDVASVAQSYLETLARAQSAPEDVRRETVEGLLRIASIQAGRQSSHLGLYDAARDNLARAETAASALTQSPALRDMRMRIALHRASLAMNHDQDFEAAARYLAAARAFMPAGGASPEAQMDLAVEEATLANWQGRYRDAARIARDAIALGAENPRDDHRGSLRRVLDGRLYEALAEGLYYLEDLAGAEVAYRQFTALSEQSVRDDPEDMEALRTLIRARWSLATTLLQRQEPRPALGELERAARAVPILLAFEPEDENGQRLGRIVLTARAQALAMSGRLDEGARLLRAQLAERESLYHAQPTQSEAVRGYAIGLAMLADLYADNDRARDACPLYDHAITVFDQLARQGRLSTLDREGPLRLAKARRASSCTPSH